MSAPAPVSSSSLSHVPSASLKRTAEDAKLEVEAKAENPAKKGCLIEWDILFSTITAEINEFRGPFSAEEVAMNIASTDLETMSLICHYDLETVKEYLSEFMHAVTDIPVRVIHNVVEQIYTISLQNGRFARTLEILEENIDDYIESTEKEHLQSLIAKATKILTKKSPNDIDKIEKQKGQITTVSKEIAEMIALSCYIDPGYQKPIQILLAGAEYEECRLKFPRLLQNLQIAQNEFTQLRLLSNQLREKQAELSSKAQPLYAAEASSEAPSPREIYLQGNYELFWNGGVKIIIEAFKRTFIDAQSKNAVPRDIRQSVKNAAQVDLRWSGYTANFLKNNAASMTDSAFISTVWTNLSENDPEDLMRLYLAVLSQSQFDTLKEQIRASQTPSVILESSTHTILGSNPTLQALNTWCENNQS